jgi:hypothetical protein
MKIKETRLKEVLNFPLSKIQDFDSDNYEHLKEQVNCHSNFIIYNYSFDNIGVTNQSELKIQNESKNKIIDLLTILFNNKAQFYYDKSTDSYLFLPYKDDFNFDDGEEVLICELAMR